MNPPDVYEPEPAGPSPAPPTPPMSPPPLAVHGDPSRPGPTQSAALPTPSAPRGQVAWVRPAELSTLVGRELLGRAVELQSTFAKGTWRAPVNVARAVRNRVAARNATDPDLALPHRTPAVPVTHAVDDVDHDPVLDGPGPEGVQLA